ncbi:MAG: hypothetical protein HIU92_13300 [Proteobacteria bacterium]|nr:hypothetical protein [Pseudomonadota bacterium]
MMHEDQRAAALLDQRTTALAARAARRGAQADQDRDQQPVSLIVWGLGAGLYGTDVAAVAAITPFARCARVPTRVPSCLGVIGRAGRFYSVIGMRRLLGVASTVPQDGEDAPDGAQPGHLLLLRGAAPHLAFAVDRVLGRFEFRGYGAAPELDGRLVAPFGPADLLSRLGRPSQADPSPDHAAQPSSVWDGPLPLESNRP